MRCACVDIGSNTTRLLVAELRGDRLHEIVCERVFTRIGAACGSDDMIPADKISEVAAVVAHQVHLAGELEARATRIVATAAIRAAPNRDALVAAVRDAARTEVAVLSPEDEARLAFDGAVRTLERPPAGTVGVADIGGGSSELVVGTASGGVTWSASLHVGSGRLASEHLRSDPPTAAELDGLRAAITAAFAGLDTPTPGVAYAVGGSATSLQRLIGPTLSHEALDDALGMLAATPADEVARRHELHLERVRILPAGLLLLREAADAFAVPLRIANGGLREGVVLEELARLRAV